MTLYFSWKETFCWDFHMENLLYRLTDPKRTREIETRQPSTGNLQVSHTSTEIVVLFVL